MKPTFNYSQIFHIPSFRQLDLIGGEGTKMAYKKVESKMWTPEKENEELEGEVVNIINGAYGTQYTIRTKEGMVSTPSHKVLQDRMLEVQKGDKVKLVYLGEQASTIEGRNATRLYDVFIDVNKKK